MDSGFFCSAVVSNFVTFLACCLVVDGALDKIKRSGVRFPLLIMCGSVEQTSHSILSPPVMSTWWEKNCDGVAQTACIGQLV